MISPWRRGSAARWCLSKIQSSVRPMTSSKPNCHCAAPGARGHGPSRSLTRAVGGKTVNAGDSCARRRARAGGLPPTSSGGGCCASGRQAASASAGRSWRRVKKLRGGVRAGSGGRTRGRQQSGVEAPEEAPGSVRKSKKTGRAAWPSPPRGWLWRGVRVRQTPRKNEPSCSASRGRRRPGCGCRAATAPPKPGSSEPKSEPRRSRWL